jgi:hypothetical protein
MSRNFGFEIMRSVANAEDVAMSELDCTLQENIEVDALRSLDSHETSQWRLTFELCDHVVTVQSDSRIFVDGVQKRAPTDSGSAELEELHMRK